MGGRFFDILMWTIVAAMLVLIVTNATGVSQLLATFAQFWVSETSILTGSNYKKAA
ncbi:MAG TPA: hypothetical protein VID72_08430 [Ktedonobacterales bacterium]|jgi:hypothetical protein